MDKQEAKQLVIDRITELQGCKATELAASLELVKVFEQFSFPELLEELINGGQIIEVAYVLPSMNYREKSFLLPVDTKIKIINNKDWNPVGKIGMPTAKELEEECERASKMVREINDI